MPTKTQLENELRSVKGKLAAHKLAGRAIAQAKKDLADCQGKLGAALSDASKLKDDVVSLTAQVKDLSRVAGESRQLQQTIERMKRETVSLERFEAVCTELQAMQRVIDASPPATLATEVTDAVLTAMQAKRDREEAAK